jgi:hypothetical protein
VQWTNPAIGPVAVACIKTGLLSWVLAEGSESLIAGYFAVVGPARRKVKNLASGGRLLDVPVEPPFIEREIVKWCDGL